MPCAMVKVEATGLKAFQVDANVVQQSLGILEIALRRFNVQSAAINRQELAVVSELVSFGMSAEVIVVIQDQEADAPSGILQEEVSR